MTTSVASLEYAPPPPLRQRRSFRRALWLLLVVAMLTGAALAWPWAWHQARFWHYQRQCLGYAASAEQVVCEEAPAWGGVIPPFITEQAPPPALAEMEKLGVSTSVRAVGPVIYMHERRTPGGQRRLLVVRRVPPGQRQSWDAPLGLHVSQWRLRPLFFADLGMTSLHEPEQFPQVFDDDQGVVALRIFAGQTDPNDPTRFTIGYETAEGRGTLTGLLRDPQLPAVEPYVAWTLE